MKNNIIYHWNKLMRFFLYEKMKVRNGIIRLKNFNIKPKKPKEFEKELFIYVTFILSIFAIFNKTRVFIYSILLMIIISYYYEFKKGRFEEWYRKRDIIQEVGINYAPQIKYQNKLILEGLI